MDFSIVIPTYNRSGTLARTLEALAGQRPPGERQFQYEVIVVDDGSTDATRDTVQALMESYPVRLVYLHQENRKQGAARNRGVESAEAEYLVFLGDDTVPKDDFLIEHQESHLRRHNPKLVVIGYTPWAPEIPSTRFMKFIGEQGWQFGFSLIADPEDVPANFFYASNLSMRRDFFLDAGGFDEDFREYGWEDVELGLRLKKAGMNIAYNPRAVAFHHHPTTIRSFIKRQRRTGRSSWTLYRKHPEAEKFLNIRSIRPFSLSTRLKMWALTVLCRLTEGRNWPDLSPYYPDLMSYYYCQGVLDGSHD